MIFLELTDTSGNKFILSADKMITVRSLATGSAIAVSGVALTVQEPYATVKAMLGAATVVDAPPPASTPPPAAAP